MRFYYYITILFAFIVSTNSFSQEIKWISLEDAVKFNAEGNDVVNFKGYTFENPNYEPARANRRNSSHQLSQAFRIQAFPTIVFLDKSSNLLHKLRGYKTPKQLEVYLKLFTDENYKKYQSQEDFNKFFESFVYEFGSK